MEPQNHVLGQTFALLAALTWATALVLFKRSGERVPPIALNLFKNSVGLVLLLATMGVWAALGRDGIADLLHQHPGDLCLLLLSGVIGIALADTVFFFALNLIGVGLISVVDCAYSPFAILFAYLLLAEKLTVFHYIGAALIVAGVFTTSRHTVPVNRTRGQIALGMLLGAFAVAMMAFGIVMVKPILEGIDVIPATAVRMFAGFVLLSLFALVGPKWKQNWTVFRPAPVWKYAVPASVLGTYLAMIFWVAGFKYTYAAVSAVLNQTSVVFACILAALFLKERFGGRQITALTLALIGVLIVTIGEQIFQILSARGDV